MEILYGLPRADRTRRGGRREVKGYRGFGIPSQYDLSESEKAAVKERMRSIRSRNRPKKGSSVTTRQRKKSGGRVGKGTDSKQAAFPSTSMGPTRAGGGGGGKEGQGRQRLRREVRRGRREGRREGGWGRRGEGGGGEGGGGGGGAVSYTHLTLPTKA